MRDFFADFHIHIGWSESKKPVKISASKNLTFFNIMYESFHHKGLDMIGIIDAHSPLVQNEINNYLNQGMLTESSEGGLQYQQMNILLGSEIEVREENRGAAHYLVFFPLFEDMQSFSQWMGRYMKNINLSSQRLYVSTKALQREVRNRGGIFIPAHVFTPFKSVFGSCCKRMEEILDLELIDAIELGLSADSEMADLIPELHFFPFLTNSDAHSLNKIGREYNKLWMNKPTFKELKLALTNSQGRKIMANYGLDPKLGKYHHSRCMTCNHPVVGERCSICGSEKIIRGVANRIVEIVGGNKTKGPEYRPPYIHQVPLEFLPKLGPKTLQKLLHYFGTEMNILHYVPKKELNKVVPSHLADLIIAAREGKLNLQVGGGGIYGKVL